MKKAVWSGSLLVLSLCSVPAFVSFLVHSIEHDYAASPIGSETCWKHKITPRTKTKKQNCMEAYFGFALLARLVLVKTSWNAMG